MQSTSGANVSEDNREDILVVLDGCVDWDNTWMLDSACSHHYTSHREWFHTYDRSNKGGSVSLGDDHPCLVAGVGTIRVRMYDGVVRTLSNVKHVPELKKNLISLDYLEEQGYAFSCQSGSGCLRITKGALVVMKGRRLSNNLYRMEGSVVSDSAEVLAAAQED